MYCKDLRSYTVEASLAGTRLDAALAPLFPGMGIRGRRRLWESWRICVNGTPRPCGHLVCEGDCITVSGDDSPAISNLVPELLHQCLAATESGLPDGYFFLSKPTGMHTQALAGKPAHDCLEHHLPHLLPKTVPQPLLCNRLDKATSGIVVVAQDTTRLQAWKQAEGAGECTKYYLTLLQGQLPRALCVANALDTANRRITRVLAHTAAPLRHTWLHPVCTLNSNDFGVVTASPQAVQLTLAVCRIHKGARHQIRAHAAHIGHPLWGDVLYGGTQGAHNFYLHHRLLQFGQWRIPCFCPWEKIVAPEMDINVYLS